MEGGAYREPGAAEGLPFPRTRMTAFAVAAPVTAAVLSILSLVGFAQGASIGRHIMVVREGLWGMYVLLVLALVLPGALAWPSIRLSRGRRVSALLVFAACVAPRLLGSVFSWVGWHRMDRALEGLLGSVVPRVVAEGTAESSGPIVLGDLVSAACAAVVAIGAAGAIGTIDVVRVPTKTAKTEPPGRSSVRATSILGAAWTIASLALFVAFVPGRGVANISLVVPFAVAGAAVLAVTVARGAPALRAHHDAADARVHLGLALLAGICAVLAIVLLEHALVVRTDAYSFSAVAGESVDPFQKVHILRECLPARAYAAIAIPLHAAFGIVTFGLASAPALSLARGSFGSRAVLVSILLLASIGAVFAVEHAKAQRRLAMANAAFDTGAVTLATVEPSGRNESIGTWHRYLFDASGAVRDEAPPDALEEEKTWMEDRARDPRPGWDEGYLMPFPTTEIFADERVTCSALFDGLHEKHIFQLRLAVLARFVREDGTFFETPDARPLGELAPLAGRPIDIVGLSIDTQWPGGSVRARIVPERAIALTCGSTSNARVSLSDEKPGAGARAVASECGARFHVDERAPFEITFGKECTVRDLAHAMAALDRAFPNAYVRGRIFHVHAESP